MKIILYFYKTLQNFIFLKFIPTRFDRVLSKFFSLIVPGKSKRKTVITFTGGMGAQIISAAIYFEYKNAGHEVYADLSYFHSDKHEAAVGLKGDISHWDWQLDSFGLTLDSFDQLKNPKYWGVDIIADGQKKMELSFNALKQTNIQKFFPVSDSVEDILPSSFSSGYLCVHIRRGDYLNVASHLVSDNDFINIINKFSRLVPNLVIVSDSSIDEDFLEMISGYKEIKLLDNNQASVAHRVMRNCKILICSNSQFSLTAGLLNSKALVIFPKKWFADRSKLNHIIKPLNDACDFQLLT